MTEIWTHFERTINPHTINKNRCEKVGKHVRMVDQEHTL